MSVSPSKREKKEAKETRELQKIPQSNQLLGMLPVGTPQDVARLYRQLIPEVQTFKSHLDVVKLYRSGLASQLEDSFCNVMTYNRKIIGLITKLVTRVKKERDEKVGEVADMVKKLQEEKTKLIDKLDRMFIVRESERGQMEILQGEKLDLEKQLKDFYDLMQRDVEKQIENLSHFKLDSPLDKDELQYATQSLASTLSQIQEEQDARNQSLKSMNNLIKAMVHNTKNDACTQVEQSELQWKAVDLVQGSEANVFAEQIEESALNLARKLDKDYQGKHLQQQLAIKQKQVPVDLQGKKQIQRPWGLPAGIMIFIQNMSKNNQNGRVLPWPYVKKLIHQLYLQRIKEYSAYSCATTSSRLTFQQIFVLYFIKQHKIRRLAELKCLQLLISIKYYAKYWPKAQLFATMLQIFKYKPSYQVNDSYAYSLDLYAQHYFFYLYERLFFQPEMADDEQGNTLLTFKRLKLMCKKVLYFSDELVRTRVLTKIEKTVRTYQKREFVDFDVSLTLLLDQYFLVRKRNQNVLSKVFGKVHQSTGGYCSIKDLEAVFKDMQSLNHYDLCQIKSLEFPTRKPNELLKLYLYAITSAKNKFDITGRQFAKAVTRFGFDSPFPSIQVLNVVKLQLQKQQEPEVTVQDHEARPVRQIVVREQEPAKKPEQKKLDRVDVAASLFSQHYAVLKQLRDYCGIFRETLQGRKQPPEQLWLHFQRIQKVLGKGCHFLKQPIVI